VKVTFTEEAVAGMDPTRLGELIQHRVGIGARLFEVVSLDEAVGRLAAFGVPVVGDVVTVPIEVETMYPAPTPEEIEALACRISLSSYASEAVDVVEDWLFTRYGVESTYRAKARAEEALANVETFSGPANEAAKAAIRRGIADGTMIVDPGGRGYA
jgi:hypothetical protein